MTYREILAQVKTEARIASDNTFDSIVINLLNELYIEATLQSRPDDLRNEVLIELLTSPAVIDLPSDFLVEHQFNFIDADTGREWMLTQQDEAIQVAPRGMYGHPKSYQVQATGSQQQVILKPYTSIVAGDKIRLMYYESPEKITTINLDTVNPNPRVEPFLIRSAIRRVRMFHSDDLQIAQMLQGDIVSAVRAYDKEPPEYNPRPEPLTEP